MPTQTLEQRTLSYWRLSRKWNGRDPETKRIRVATALKRLNAISDVTFYQRPLKDKARTLADEIIRGGNTKKPARSTQEPAPVAKLEKAQQ